MSILTIRGLLFAIISLNVQKGNAASDVVISPVEGLVQIALTDDNPSSTIYSPNFPDQLYPPNVHVYYNVSVSLREQAPQMAARIRITFEMFALEPGKYCTSDGLEITEPVDKVTVFCGSQSGEIFLSRSNKLEMRFFTDSKLEERGFSLKLEIFRSTCSATLTKGPSGIITSPGFPQFYQNFELCVWKIEAPPGKRIRLGFNDIFAVESPPPLCFNDYITVSRTGDLETDITRYCGKEAPAPIISKSNVMIVMFTSECCIQEKGFSATYSFVEEAPPVIPDPVIPERCNCGKENLVETRVVNGEEVSPKHRYPWMAYLYNDKLGPFCGAAIISRSYLLTAAHCVNKQTPTSFVVILGAFDQTDLSKTVQMQVTNITVHRQFNPVSFINDIALLKTKEMPENSINIQAICLPPIGFNTTGRIGKIAGWGQTKEAGEMSNKLLEATMDAVPLAECKQKYGSTIIDSHMCALGRNKSDACQGDSGGPLISKLDNRDVIMGVVSWGIGCGRDGYPGIFSAVSAYLPWIQDKTKDSPPPCTPGDQQREPPLQPNAKDCGIPNVPIQSRVVGGNPSYNLEYPWLAILVYKGKYFAVGALISPNYVITTAHWLLSNNPLEHSVILGRHNVQVEESQAKTYNVEWIMIHPYFQAGPIPKYDLAIFKLREPAADVFRPICLPRGYEALPTGSKVYAAGWGQKGDDLATSDVLRTVELKTISLETCKKPYWYYLVKLTDSSNCAEAPGKGLCYEDDGAPLMAFYEGRYYLNGLFSWRYERGCAMPGKPDVFASIHKNLDWITYVTKIEVALGKR